MEESQDRRPDPRFQKPGFKKDVMSRLAQNTDQEKKNMRRIRTTLIVTVLVTFVLQLSARGSQYGMVKNAAARTVDGIAFTVTIRKQTVAFGQNVTLNYTAKNLSPMAIYLVHENPSKFDSDGETVWVQSPMPIGSHGDYNFTFTRIRPGKEFRGSIIVPARMFPSPDVWPVEVAFGYVHDIAGLKGPLLPGEDPAKRRGRLSATVIVVVVGKLGVNLK